MFMCVSARERKKPPFLKNDVKHHYANQRVKKIECVQIREKSALIFVCPSLLALAKKYPSSKVDAFCFPRPH